MDGFSIGQEFKEGPLAYHIALNNILSYVNFQSNGRHICGGARLAFDQVLVLNVCFNELAEIYFDIWAEIPAIPNRVFTLKGYKEVPGTSFYIIVVSSITNIF